MGSGVRPGALRTSTGRTTSGVVRVTSLPMTDFPRPAAPQAENPAQQRVPAAIGTARLPALDRSAQRRLIGGPDRPGRTLDSCQRVRMTPPPEASEDDGRPERTPLRLSRLDVIPTQEIYPRPSTRIDLMAPCWAQTTQNPSQQRRRPPGGSALGGASVRHQEDLLSKKQLRRTALVAVLLTAVTTATAQGAVSASAEAPTARPSAAAPSTIRGIEDDAARSLAVSLADAGWRSQVRSAASRPPRSMCRPWRHGPPPGAARP